MIKFVAGHRGVLCDIEDDDDALYMVEVIIHQLKNLDEGHALIEPLENILEEFE